LKPKSVIATQRAPLGKRRAGELLARGCMFDALCDMLSRVESTDQWNEES
jgi:hypothetical protein